MLFLLLLLGNSNFLSSSTCRIYSMWTHPGFRSQESQGLLCSFTGCSLVLCAPHPTEETPWNSCLLPAAGSWTTSVLLRPHPGFLLLFHSGLAPFMAQQNTCPACIPHNIEFSIRSIYHSHSTSAGCFLGSSLGVSFREIFSLCLHFKSGAAAEGVSRVWLVPQQRASSGWSLQCWRGDFLYPHTQMGSKALEGDSALCLWHQPSHPRRWHSRASTAYPWERGSAAAPTGCGSQRAGWWGEGVGESRRGPPSLPLPPR